MSVPRTAIVFGGSGFLGHAVVQTLADEGWSVRVPTRFMSKAQDLKGMGLPEQITPFPTSLRAEAALSAAMEGCEAAVNLIGSFHERGKHGFQTAHVEMAARLARLAKSAGVRRFTHISTVGADKTASEPYARTKGLGEDAVHAFFPSATVLRPDLMFGPRDRLFNGLALMARFAPFLPLFDGGEARLRPVYVGDVAFAVRESLHRSALQGGTFEVVGSQHATLRDALGAVLHATERKRLLFPLPWGAAKALAHVLSFLPNPPLSPAQLHFLQKARQGGKAPDLLPLLGRQPLRLADVLPTYLC